MKTRNYIFLVVLLTIPMIYFTSCDKVKQLTSVNVSMKLPRQHFVYTGSQLKTGGELILYSGLVHINLDSLCNANGFSSGIIQNTSFTNLSVTIEQPADSTFHWLSSMRATVADNQNFQPENQIGSVTNSDPNAKTVIITTNNVNIRPYLTQPSFYFRLYGVINGSLPAVTVGMFLDGTIQLTIAPL
jgi:hypothetical protein